MKLLLKILLGAAAALLNVAHAAGDYPSKPIRIVVPYAPGGLTDTLARSIAEQLGAALKQSVVVDNRPGAGTLVGARAVHTSPPDGYTLFAATSTTLAAAPSLYKEYIDPVRGFTHISLVATNPFFMVSNAARGYKSVADVVAAAKRDAAKGLSYGSAGNGTPHHLIMEMFREQAKINLVHVPYQGSGKAIAGLVEAGGLDIMISDLTPALPFLKSGRINALAVADSQRSPFLPDVPTFAEAGLPGVSLVAWQSVVGPAGMPTQVTAKLNEAINRIVASPELAKRCATMGCDAAKPMSPKEFTKYVETEGVRWQRVVKSAGIQPR